MIQAVFFLMTLAGALVLGKEFLDWWMSIFDAGLITTTPSLLVVIVYIILAASQVIYIGDKLFGDV